MRVAHANSAVYGLPLSASRAVALAAGNSELGSNLAGVGTGAGCGKSIGGRPGADEGRRMNAEVGDEAERK